LVSFPHEGGVTRSLPPRIHFAYDVSNRRLR
jgi:hypothetical protein